VEEDDDNINIIEEASRPEGGEPVMIDNDGSARPVDVVLGESLSDGTS